MQNFYQKNGRFFDINFTRGGNRFFLINTINYFFEGVFFKLCFINLHHKNNM